MSKARLFTEDVVYQDGIELDEANCLVKNVKVAGLISRNKRRYEKAALEGAVKLYENVKVNVDHPDQPVPGGKTKPREFADRFGRLRNPRWTPTGIRADLHYNPEHQHTKLFLWWVKNDPSAIGLSHNILGVAYENEQGETVIEKIEEVKSVDLVADSATTQGLVEGVNDLQFDFQEEGGKEEQPGGVSPGEPSPAPTEPDGDDDECDHLCNAATAIIKNKDLDKKTKLSKLRRLLGLIHDEDDEKENKMPANKTEPDVKGGPGDDGSGTGPKKVTEATFIDAVELDTLLTELQTLRAEKARVAKKDRVVGLCREAELPVDAQSEVFVESLLVHEDEVLIKRLIDDRKALLRTSVAKKPISSPSEIGPAGNDQDKKAAFLSLFKTEEN